ncbi:RNA-directed DNA polymerase [Pseudomonas sp. TH39(2020)]|uniref:reverse transcriptase family protein n=1 Tax=Pseudomonas sp. TH39(2020) TaxID=2796349 RepID=UPI001914894E|nr:reverse transcriptase family protein [Pseudomonas sp. TH39(2020)]MBK5401114.1 RNA-directed DNA polymerase [Pseudomonas sp. TH39(2020)]
MVNRDFKSAFEAMYHGKYDFEDFKSGDISEKFRKLDLNKKNVYEADQTLKIYHKFLNLFVFQWLEFNENCVYSYRKGMNVADAVKKHAHSKHFYQTDLNNFFGSIRSDFVKGSIIASIDRMPITDVLLYVDRIIEICTVSNKLPVGFSTSPLISNACLLHFDNEVERYCEESGLIYTRYSDDIIISGGDKKLYGTGEIIAEVLYRQFEGHLSINSSKTKYSSAGNKLKILGMMILPNGTITIDSKLKADIEVLLHFFTKDKQKFLDKIEADSATALAKVSGYLNYINTTDKVYLNKLRKKYGASVVDMFVRGSVKSL